MPAGLDFLPIFDEKFFEIVWLFVSATALAGLVGRPLGAALALLRFSGRWGFIVIFNAFMDLPPVVVGLVAYLLLLGSGPLGFLGLLSAPLAMVIAQSMLVLPIMLPWHGRPLRICGAIVLLGPNGSGKSSVLHLAMGLMRAKSRLDQLGRASD
jgi:ABC-type tungstate transport system substrate-binding protein